MECYDELQKIIEESEDVNFGKGCKDKNIEDAERRMGVEFPLSYKWWLKNYGGGEVYGSEVLGVYESDLGTWRTGDIEHHYIINKEEGFHADNEIVILDDPDLEDLFYFNINDITDVNGNEYAVYSFRHGNTKYADNFVEFLKKLILERKEEWDVR